MHASFSTLLLALTALTAHLATAAPITTAPTAASKCTSHLAFTGRDLPFAYDDGATSTLLPTADSPQANQQACIDWAKSQGFYVATLSTTGVPEGQVKCYAKNVPHYPEYKYGMYRQKVWEDEVYLGPYNVIGYDIPIRWWGTYGQGLSACDSYTVEGEGQNQQYYCKRYPTAEGATLLLAAGCPKS